MHVIGPDFTITRESTAFETDFALQLLSSVNPGRLTHISLGLRIISTRVDEVLPTVLFGEWSALDRVMDSFPALVSVRILTARPPLAFTLQDLGDPLEFKYLDVMRREFQLLDTRGILQFV